MPSPLALVIGGEQRSPKEPLLRVWALPELASDNEAQLSSSTPSRGPKAGSTLPSASCTSHSAAGGSAQGKSDGTAHAASAPMSLPAWRWLYDIPLPANVAAAIADQPLQEIAEFPAPQLELLEQHELKMLRPKACHRSSVRVSALAVIDAGR
jgi:hypothetical protein